MPKLIITQGIPASGKTTWANAILDSKRGANTIRVNRDSLRQMLHNNFNNKKFSKERERIVTDIQAFAIVTGLVAGKNVIVDDTNLNPKTVQKLKDLVAKFKNVEVEIKDFADTPLEECIRRDNARAHGVGKTVIMDFYNKYIKPLPANAPEYHSELPDCVICDIDGTLADHTGVRSPFDWDKVGLDKPHKDIIDIVKMLSTKVLKIILFSGRDEVCRTETEKWLQKHSVPYFDLYMRPKDNNEKDTIIKSQMYDEHILGFYNVIYVLDDRQQVVNMWREKYGLRVLQVAPGDF